MSCVYTETVQKDVGFTKLALEKLTAKDKKALGFN